MVSLRHFHFTGLLEVSRFHNNGIKQRGLSIGNVPATSSHPTHNTPVKFHGLGLAAGSEMPLLIPSWPLLIPCWTLLTPCWPLLTPCCQARNEDNTRPEANQICELERFRILMKQNSFLKANNHEGPWAVTPEAPTVSPLISVKRGNRVSCGNRVWLCFPGKGDCFSAFLPLHTKSLTCLRTAHMLQLQQPGPRTGSDPGRSHSKFSITDIYMKGLGI